MKNINVCAYITTYNEIDILKKVVQSLLCNKVHIHVIDNWSTDGTFEVVKDLAKKNSQITFERFPSSFQSKEYDWKQILTRIQNIANSSHADWLLHVDADEIRISPWKNLNLKQAIQRVDSEGYNAIDFAVLNFRPTKEGFNKDTDPEKFFTHYEFGDQPGDFVQIKAWKNNHNVDILSSGGHEAIFKGRKVYPKRFILKHYSLRSSKQIKKKIFKDRIPRLKKCELKLGWHQHILSALTNLKTRQSYLWDEKTLIRFNINHFYTPSTVENLMLDRTLALSQPTIKLYQDKIQHLQDSLSAIQSTKFYKLWQLYLKLTGR